MSFTSKRRARMNAYLETNKPELYASHDERISDEMAAMILRGDFAAFDESIAEWEWDSVDYLPWGEWESDFAETFGYDEWGAMPERLQEWAKENREYSAGDWYKTLIREWSGHIVARVCMANGDYVEFPAPYADDSENARWQRYLARHCGHIDGWKAEATYPGTILCILGTVDLWKLVESQAVPTHAMLDADCFLIGHEPMNGSGTMGDIAYNGKPRRVRVELIPDNSMRYGIDSVYGLVGSCWRNEIELVK